MNLKPRDFTKERAKSIKDLLSSSGGNNQYNNYDKRSYQAKCDELFKLTDAEQKAKILDESDFDAQKRKKESAPLDKLEILNYSYPDTPQLTSQVDVLLKRTVVSAVMWPTLRPYTLIVDRKINRLTPSSLALVARSTVSW